MTTAVIYDARRQTIKQAQVGDVVIAPNGVAYTIVKIKPKLLGGDELTLERYETASAKRRAYKTPLFAIRDRHGQLSNVRNT